MAEKRFSTFRFVFILVFFSEFIDTKLNGSIDLRIFILYGCVGENNETIS